VLVVNRFRVPEWVDPVAFRERLDAAADVLRTCAGLEHAEVGRNVDEPEMWVLVTRWADVGSYRRALSSYDVKVGVVPLLSEAIDEPSAYEVPDTSPDGGLNRNQPRGLG